jgi:predicted nucleotidyltransferase
MAKSLTESLQILKDHQFELRRRGVQHAAVFGSVARGKARVDSDVDILIDLDPTRPMGLFEYAALKLYIDALFGGAADVVNRKTLKPLLRDTIMREAVDAF